MKRRRNENVFEFNPNKKRKTKISLKCIGEPTFAALKNQHHDVKLITQLAGLDKWSLRDNIHLLALMLNKHIEWARFLIGKRVEFYIIRCKYSQEYEELMYEYQDIHQFHGKLSANMFMPWYDRLDIERKLDISPFMSILTDVIDE